MSAVAVMSIKVLNENRLTLPCTRSDTELSHAKQDSGSTLSQGTFKDDFDRGHYQRSANLHAGGLLGLVFQGIPDARKSLCVRPRRMAFSVLNGWQEATLHTAECFAHAASKRFGHVWGRSLRPGAAQCRE